MSNMTCEQCGTASGAQHTFHYGRTAPDGPMEAPVYHASAYLSPTAHTEQFQLGGIEAVVLCERCLARARARRAARLLRSWIAMPLILAAYAVVVVGAIAWAATGDWAQAAIWFGVAIAVTAAAYGVAYAALRDEDFAQHTAVDIHMEQLREQGWDSFWTDKEFASLTPH